MGDVTMAAAPSARALLSVSGMRDERCARSVRSALSLIGGVTAVAVYVRTREARVSFDPQKVAAWQLRKAVRAVGFESVVKQRGANPV